MSTQETFAFADPAKGREECAADGNLPSWDTGAGIDRTLPCWLGLVTSHRRLFDAGQDGWLRPSPRSCFLLGRESFVSEELPAGRNVIPVRLTFDVNKLPFPDARKDLERSAARNNDGDEPRAIHWRAPIPLYAVRKVEISSPEQKTRLRAMAEQFSNVCLPSPETEVGDFALPSPVAGGSAGPEAQSLELPETLNAIQGAMAMAVWAVPRVEPWIEVLERAMGLDATGVAHSWPSGSGALPPSQRSSLERTRENGCFTMTWRGRPVVRKPWHSRAKWYGADLTDDTIGRAALDLADRLGWPCIERRRPLPEGRVQAAGSGHLSVDGDALVVEGERSLRRPRGVDIDERFDPDEFRRRLATEAGVVPDPPEASGRQPEHEVPGLVYKPDFITEEEETKLLACIDGAEWSTELQRRVQHYGWRYDYKQRRIDESMRLGELPEWARVLGRRLVNEGLMKDLPDQVIVNEYRGKQGISRHIDQPRSFAEHVATISLHETWGMVFRRRGGKEKVEKPIERRSVAVLTGDARYKWTHEIPNRANEPRMEQGKRRRVKRTRRISLTFRTVRLERNA